LLVQYRHGRHDDTAGGFFIITIRINDLLVGIDSSGDLGAVIGKSARGPVRKDGSSAWHPILIGGDYCPLARRQCRVLLAVLILRWAVVVM